MTPTERRFEAIIGSGLLTSKDIEFANSLYSSYKRKRALTAGRRRCLAQLEARVADRRANPVVPDSVTVALIDTLSASPSRNDWERSMLRSFREQIVIRGSELSDKQTALIEKFASEDKIRADFDFDAEKAELFAAAVGYYRASPGDYWSHVVAKVDGDPSYVPSPREFQKMTGNKFFQKVLAVERSAPKFTPGQMVTFNSTVSNNQAMFRRYWTSLSQNGLTANALSGVNIYALSGIILKGSAGPVINAAKGAKPTLVLFFGAQGPIMVEERHLKKAKKKGKR